jgi:hypothetical protein
VSDLLDRAIQVPPRHENACSLAPRKRREPSKIDAGYRAVHLQWKGDALYLYGKGCAVVRIVSDKTYAGMWRVELPDGRLSDMVNRARAKDVALSIACDVLNQREEAVPA